MRTCTNCGAQFRDDELVCPVCGQEVQLVPDYVTIESHYQEDELKKEEEERKRQEELERQSVIEDRRKQMHRNIFLTVSLVVVAIAAIVLFLVISRVNRNANSYDYQYAKAESAYQTGDYEDALSYIQNAIELDSTDEALLLEAKIYIGMKNTDSAAGVLEELIASNSDLTEAYDLLIQIYLDNGETDKIEVLLAACKNEEILARYSGYLVKAPTISPDGGTFTSKTTVTISTASTGTIYYTDDGTVPTKNSTEYTGPFELSEGTHTIRAVVVTDAGISSDVTTADFQIDLDTPSAPKISPASGSYTYTVYEYEDGAEASDSEEDEEQVHEITITVPEGYTCYYDFDAIPSKDSDVYTKPVEMLEGEHVFYAVFESSEGKLGKIASATYIYTEETVTVTPTPTATPTPTETPRSASSTYNASETYDSETVETPTPTPTESASSENQEDDSSSSSTSDSSDSSGTSASSEESDTGSSSTSAGTANSSTDSGSGN